MEHIMVRPAVGWGHERDELPKAVLTQAELVKGFSLLFNILEKLQSSASSRINTERGEPE